MKKKGKVWIVGAGPGDPSLLTEKAVGALSRAEVVLHDALVHPAALNHAGLADWIPVGKRGDGDSIPQAATQALMVRLARLGREVVRLKGGDPFILGRGGEEIRALERAGIPYEIVPGLSSATAVPAALGIPLTQRGVASNFAVTTGRTREGGPDDVPWELLAHAAHTLVVLMGAGRSGPIASRLLKAGKDPATPVAAIRWGTWPGELLRRTTLGKAAEALSDLTSPVVLVVGPTAALGRAVTRRSAGPLTGVRVVSTRGGGFDLHEPFARRIERAGGIVRLVGVTEQATRDRDRARLASRLRRGWGGYDWIVLTSRNAVSHLDLLVQAAGLDWRRQAHARIAAIGRQTATNVLRTFGMKPDVIPRVPRAEALLARMGAARGTRILIPRAAEARDVLPRGLRRGGARVTILPVYRTVPMAAALRNLRRIVLTADADVVLFASGSGVECSMKALGAAGRRAFRRRVLAASIGPVTSAALRTWGIRPAIQARTASMEELAAAVVRYYRKHPRAPRLR